MVLLDGDFALALCYLLLLDGWFDFRCFTSASSNPLIRQIGLDFAK